MRKMYKLPLLVLFAILLSNLVYSQNRFFTDAGKNTNLQTTGKRAIFPQKFNGYSMDVQGMRSFLWSLPSENSIATDRSNAPIMEFPMPDGTTAKFNVWESNIMEPALAAKFPDMKQFLGQGIDDPYATIRFDYNPYTGLHGQILSAKTGRVLIDPYANGDLRYYMSYFGRDAVSPEKFVCNVEQLNEPDPSVANRTAAACLGTTLRTYRLALACTGEYAVAVNGPTPNTAGVAAAMLTAVNRVSGVYEVETAVRMVLVANNDLLIYLNGASDPYTNNNGGTMLGQNQANIDAVIGSANYDIGHVFSTGGGGVAGLGVVCNNANKARGVTGLTNPVGDAFYIDYVAHEMGHQYGGNHTFNSQTGSCAGGNRNASTAYEPGSGTTIQAYAGICGSDDIQPNSDPVFHAISFDEISNLVNGAASCGAQTATGNTLPVIAAFPANVTIPISTPFTLTGSATDANGDALTYSWEEMDLGGSGAWNSGATSTTSPLFKSRIPKTTGSRTFPDIAVILAGFPANPTATLGGLKGETLPSVARDMKFRLTVRDNRAGGGGVVSSGSLGCQSAAAMTVTTAGTAPFIVTSPNGGENYLGGSSQTITWNVVGTNAAPFNVANVKISLSTDGGLTYPIVLSASTPNDGTESLAMPLSATTTARVKIEAIGNIFFDISNANFTISPPLDGFTFNSPAAVVAACPAPNVMTSGNLTATYFGSFTGNITLSAVVNPAGPTVSFSNNPLSTGSPSTTVSLTGMSTLNSGNYVVTVTGVGVGVPSISRDITFTINPGTGPTITTQPASQSVCVGSNATFTAAAATGTYQWQVSTAAIPAFTNISGQTGTSLTLTAVTSAMNGNQYRVVVTGQCGSTNSNAATLTVNTLPVITSSPSNLNLCSGSSAAFTVAATGSTLTYQWEVSTDGGANYNPIAGATSATYNIASVTTAMNNNRYRAVVSGACTPAATSAAATLVVSSSITITTNPSSQTLCEGTTTTFTTAAGGSGLTYQWQVSTDGGANYSNVPAAAPYSGTTTTTLTITNIPPTLNGYRYRAVASNAACTPGVSTAAILTVNTFPVVTTPPASLTICEGAAATFSVVATTGVGTLTYQWQLSTNGGTTWANITGATSASFAQPAVPATQNGYRFRVIVTAGCGSVTSSAAILTVNTFPVITFAPTSVVCVSDGAFSLSATPAGGAFAGPGVSGSTFTPSVAGVGAKTVTYTVSNAGCQTVASRTIQVNECPERHRTLSQFPAIVVYPIPNRGNFNIRLNTDLYTKLNIKLYNSAGQLVKSEVATGLTFGSVIPVSATNLPNGVYHLFLANDERNEVSTKGVSIIIQSF